MIAIIDYGMGNIHSVQKALEACGAKTIVTNNAKVIAESDKVVLPGVGAFDDAVRELKKRKLIQALKDHLKKGKILLGICLGMQILFEASEEGETEKGLGIVKGKVKKFVPVLSLKVPHIGWNQLNIKHTDCPLLKDITNKSYVYFCHSYYALPLDKNLAAATTDYGLEFASIAWQDNIYAAQFHPEKSQETGMKILKNFIELK